MEIFPALLAAQRSALMFYLICAWTDSWAKNGDAGDLRRYRAHYDVIVMMEKYIATVIYIMTVAMYFSIITMMS